MMDQISPEQIKQFQLDRQLLNSWFTNASSGGGSGSGSGSGTGGGGKRGGPQHSGVAAGSSGGKRAKQQNQQAQVINYTLYTRHAHKIRPFWSALNPAVVEQLIGIKDVKDIQTLLQNWQWCEIDSVRVPCVVRPDGRSYTAVRVLEHCVMSKFQHLMYSKPVIRVRHMSLVEAVTFNQINVRLCDYQFGVEMFHAEQDFVVDMFDARKVYWATKYTSLHSMIINCDRQIQLASGLNPSFALSIRLVQNELRLQQMQARVCHQALQPNGP